jgi:hypothetical protein
MAKAKKTEVEEQELEVLEPKTVAVNWQEVAVFNETKANEALERSKQLEDLLAVLMPDLRVASKYLNGIQVDAGRRLENSYRAARDLLGERGLQIDKGVRGA